MARRAEGPGAFQNRQTVCPQQRRKVASHHAQTVIKRFLLAGM